MNKYVCKFCGGQDVVYEHIRVQYGDTDLDGCYDAVSAFMCLNPACGYVWFSQYAHNTGKGGE